MFWDSAVDAVITDKANVKNPAAKVNQGTDAEKVNNNTQKVDIENTSMGENVVTLLKFGVFRLTKNTLHKSYST